MRAKEAYLWANGGDYYVLTYPGQEQVTRSSLNDPTPAIRRANRKGYTVRTYTGNGIVFYRPTKAAGK